MNIRRPAGALESDVLAALTAGTEPMTAAQVRTAMGDGLAYTTVMTVLSRLAAKGLVVQEPRGRAYAYSPIRDQAEITALRMRRLLEAGGDRAAVLARFVGTLSDDDEQLLLDMLASPDRDPQP
ncbi:MAG TPA: BlaI/MecI/CopY family transcriptional regulator [Micromonosporaceae bacterium]|jgi:predicted transcriptional regulator